MDWLETDLEKLEAEQNRTASSANSQTQNLLRQLVELLAANIQEPYQKAYKG
jgi:hypothetical protein